MQEAGLELSKSTFSHHLRIMREAGLVTKRVQGARGYAQLRIHPRRMLPRLATPLKTGEDSGSPADVTTTMEHRCCPSGINAPSLP